MRMGRIIGAVITVAVVLGMKFWGKSHDSDETKAHLISVCSGDAGCISTVNNHFDSCFESAYSMGGRHRSSTLNTSALAACLNSRGGQSYFSSN